MPAGRRLTEQRLHDDTGTTANALQCNKKTAAIAGSAEDASTYFQIPSNRVVEIGTQIVL